jgi:hypothetical protein
MTLEGRNQALLAMEGMRPWRLERAAAGAKVILATRLSRRTYPREIRVLRDRLRGMADEDQAARMQFDPARMEAAGARHGPEVVCIFERYGWVTKSLAGKDASYNFWLLVQHQTLEIQQRMLPALEKAARGGDASMRNYAYLYDRVQMGQSKPQHWGTQVNCEGGKPVLYAVDDPAGLDARRKELSLPPIGEYLRSEYLIKVCAGSTR